MVAVRQSSVSLRLEEPMRSVAVSYDDAPRVAFLEAKNAIDESYEKGYNEASSQYNQQILEFRSEVNELREQTFSDLENKFEKVLGEAKEALMSLTYECVRRVLGGYEMEPAAVSKIVDTMISESGLNEEAMEIRMNPADIDLLSELDENLKTKHSKLEFVGDAGLGRGDCVLSSRFGKVDGMMAAKMDRLKESLGG